MDELSTNYLSFLKHNKTGVEVCDYIHFNAKKHGFQEKGAAPNDGQLKLSLRFNNRCGALLVINDFAALKEGLKIVATHVDSPHLDLKPVPAFENCGLGALQTRYYGGIKKHHWVGVPLELHGRGTRASGETFDVRIGRDADDPVFTISDLAPHLGYDPKTGGKSDVRITAEHLNVIAGTTPSNSNPGSDAGGFAAEIFAALGLEAGDFITGEFEIVPATEPRFVGFGKKLMGGYGHDNRSCTYAAYAAFIQSDMAQENCAFVFTDREEVGSQGVHGADSNLLERFLFEVFDAYGSNDYFALRQAISNSVMISGDVNVGVDPSWPERTDKQNSGHIGSGVCLTKYTGSGGKRMASEADSSLVSQMRRLMEQKDIAWQQGELGKVDGGGGGTVAKHFARQGVQVFDLGPPVLSMHSPFEILSTADLDATHKAFQAFWESFVISDPMA